MNHMTYDYEICTLVADEHLYTSCAKIFPHFEKCNITHTKLNVKYFTKYSKTVIIIIIIIIIIIC